MSNQITCTCNRCVNACHHKPGWFMPGEAENAAALLGVDLQTFFNEYLLVDWYERWEGINYDQEEQDVFVLSPATTNNKPGQEFPGKPTGRCVFLKDNRCSIHAAKPYECRMHMHGDSQQLMTERKRGMTAAWQTQQEQIITLLGREPVASPYSAFVW